MLAEKNKDYETDVFIDPSKMINNLEDSGFLNTERKDSQNLNIVENKLRVDLRSQKSFDNLPIKEYDDFGEDESM